MSEEIVHADDSAPGEEAIPVCTLFSDGAPQGNGDFQTVPDSGLVEGGNTLEPDVHPQTSASGERKESEPALCNVFAGSSASVGSDDIFSKISGSNTDATSNIADGAQEKDLLVPAMETLRLSPSVDSFVVEDLVESDAKSSSEHLPTEPDRETERESVPDLSTSDTTEKIDDRASDSPSPVVQGSKSLQKSSNISSSFASIASFAIESNEITIVRSANQHSSLPTEQTEIGGLSIEGVKKELADATPMPSAEKSLSESNVTVTSKEEVFVESNTSIPQAEPLTQFEKKEEIQTTGALFSSQQDIEKTSLFGIENIGDVEEDDPFATALINSALDRRRDAWIPSEATKSLLVSCVVDQKAPDLETQKMTRPGLSTSEVLGDPVKGLVIRLTGSESVVKRENLTIEDVTQDKTGVEKLMESGNHRSAANLCAKLLTHHGQGFGRATQSTTNTPETLWLWYTRIYILTKLKLYEMAATELAAFKNLDNPDVYFEFYPNIYPGRHGSMAPFEFRLLHAEFPRHVEKPQESLNRLCKISAVCSKVLSNLKRGKTEMGEESTTLDAKDLEASIAFWTERKVVTLYCTGSVLIQLNEHVLAVQAYDEILSLQPQNAVAIQSEIGRLYLHIGDIRAAKERFTVAEQAAESGRHKVLLLLNRGFMYIGTNNWKEAFTQFDSALNLEPTNITALNNKAVCLLYLSRLKDAISILESGAVQQTSMEVVRKVENVNRQQALVEGLVSNLSTLYELESSRFVLKKRALFLKQMAPSCGDSFNVACFKEI